MITLKQNKSFAPLFVTNFFGTMNDNFLKTLAGFTVVGWIPDERMKSVAMGVTAAALVLPYILCSPLADRLTAVWRKTSILRAAKWAELPIAGIAVAGFALESPCLVVGAVLLMGLQSALYSPAKYALVRDVGGESRISVGMGGMEGVSFLGVLAGTVAGALAADLPPAVGFETRTVCLVGFAAAGLAAACTVRADETRNRALHAIDPVRYLARAWRMARRHEGLNAVIVTLSVFWWAAAMLQMGLLVYGKSADGLGLDATRTGALLCAAALGIVSGQVLAGFVDARRPLLGATLLTGWTAAGLLCVLAFADLSPLAFGAVLTLLAFDLGFFKLPFDAEIQKTVKGPRLNTILSYFNQMSFLFMLAASGCYALASWAFGPKAFLPLLAIAFFVAPAAFVLSHRATLTATGRRILRRRYAVETRGLAAALATVGRRDPSLPAAYLVLPNHPAMVDPMIVATELGDLSLKPLVDESFFTAGFLAPRALATLGAVAVPDLRRNRSRAGASIARGLEDVVRTALAGGENVLFYPSGRIWTEPAEKIGTRRLAYTLCRDLPPNVEVVAVRTSGLWGSIWSRKNRTSSPPFLPTLAKSVFLWLFRAPFVPRRTVTLHAENVTARAREWALGTRLAFNRELENWYNADVTAR